jgi:hypothetical protein
MELFFHWPLQSFWSNEFTALAFVCRTWLRMVTISIWGLGTNPRQECSIYGHICIPGNPSSISHSSLIWILRVPLHGNLVNSSHWSLSQVSLFPSWIRRKTWLVQTHLPPENSVHSQLRTTCTVFRHVHATEEWNYRKTYSLPWTYQEN